MNRLYAALVHLDRDLTALGCRWALIGGLAVGARAEPRTTRDIDVVIAVADDRQAETLIFDLKARGYGLLSHHFEQDAQDRLSTVRLTVLKQGLEGVNVDLLFASSGIEHEIAAAADLFEKEPGFAIPLAKTGHLLALKVLAYRPERGQDFNDAKALAQVADAKELQRARDALRLIRRRGYDREKGEALFATLEDVLAAARRE